MRKVHRQCKSSNKKTFCNKKDSEYYLFMTMDEKSKEPSLGDALFQRQNILHSSSRKNCFLSQIRTLEINTLAYYLAYCIQFLMKKKCLKLNN